MAYETRVTVFPDIPVQPNGGGGFPPEAFGDLIGLEIHMPGLDKAWVHTLTAAQVADDRDSAELTCHSTPIAPKSLDRALRVVTWQPAAHVRASDRDGTELAVTKLDAPLQRGELVEVGGEAHRVVDTAWPHRHPETGVCHQGID